MARIRPEAPDLTLSHGDSGFCTNFVAGVIKYGIRLQLDLDLDTGGQLQAHESFHSLLGGADDVDEALVSAALKLLPAVLVLVNSAQDGDDFICVGRGMGPETLASVRLAVSTMVSAALSISW